MKHNSRLISWGCNSSKYRVYSPYTDGCLFCISKVDPKTLTESSTASPPTECKKYQVLGRRAIHSIKSCLLRASFHHSVHVFDDIMGIRYKRENVNNNIPKWIVYSTCVKFPYKFCYGHFLILPVSSSVLFVFGGIHFCYLGQIIWDQPSYPKNVNAASFPYGPN